MKSDLAVGRVLLIEPPFYRLFKDTYSLDRQPLSLGYLSGVIREKTDWDVMAYNADFSVRRESFQLNYMTGEGFDNYLNGLKDLSREVWQEVLTTLLEYCPDVVGISAKSQNFASALVIGRLAKGISDKVIVVVGGPHPSMVGKEVLKHPEVDIGVRGEGEVTMVELLQALQSRRGLGDINGIVYRQGKEFVETPARAYIGNLDSLPFPHQFASQTLKDYDKFPLTAFRSIFAIRGCPYHCFFCGSHKIWSRKIRARSIDNVVTEIKALQGLGLKLIHFDDDTFGVNKTYIRNLCNALMEKCPQVKWSCEMHVKLIDASIVAMMKKAGCFSIDVGIESGNNEILRQIGKNITIEEALTACRIIKKQGLELKTFFMLGFPQETEETLEDTFKAIKQLPSDVLILSLFTPYPGTQAFQFCTEHSLIGEEFDYSRYNHQSPGNYFCMNVSLDTFRKWVVKIEKYLDRRNALSRIKRIFSSITIMRMSELGLLKSLKKAIQLLQGK